MSNVVELKQPAKSLCILCCVCLRPVAYVSGDYPVELHTCPYCHETEAKKKDRRQ